MNGTRQTPPGTRWPLPSPLLFVGMLWLLPLLAGCLVGPDHRPPAPLGTNPVPSRFDQATNGLAWVPARADSQGSQPLPVAPDWWRAFQDPEADRLVAWAMEANPSLAIAAANVARARAEAQVTGAALWPSARLSGSYTRQRGSANAFNPGNAAGVGRTYSLTTIPLEATWEPDLWGRVRRLREQAQATVQSTETEADAVRLALQAEVVGQVIRWRSLGIQSRVLTETTNSLARALDLTRQRRQGGLGTDLEVNQATTLLASAAAQLPGIHLQRLRLEHALATLCGRPANGFRLADTPQGWPNPDLPEFPEGLPSELLERRPDIAAAERRVAAANAAIGVAHAAFYPRFHLSAMGGLQSLHGSDVFTAPSRMWSLGPGVELPVFTGGRLRGQLASARATHEGSVAAYRETVLNALQEVEDGLAAHRELAARAALEQVALAAARRSRDLAENRYRSGLVSYLEVVAAQTAALERELAVARLDGERRLNAVALARALGGGWQPRSEGSAGP